jgi:hypothetical protein
MCLEMNRRLVERAQELGVSDIAYMPLAMINYQREHNRGAHRDHYLPLPETSLETLYYQQLHPDVDTD